MELRRRRRVRDTAGGGCLCVQTFEDLAIEARVIRLQEDGPVRHGRGKMGSFLSTLLSLPCLRRALRARAAMELIGQYQQDS